MMSIIKNKKLKIDIFLLVITIFTKEIGMYQTQSDIQLDLIAYPIYTGLFLYILFTRQIWFSNRERNIFTLIFLHGIIIYLFMGFNYSLFFKQFIPLIVIYLVSKFVIHKYDIHNIMNLYVRFSFAAAIFGLIQLLFKLLNILILTPYNGFFIDSVALEPSHYVAIILPAAIYLYETKTKKKLIFYTIIVSLILTFKATIVISTLLYFTFRNVKKITNLIIAFSLYFFIFFILTQNNIEFNDRALGFINFYHTNDLDSINNLTSFSFISNFIVAANNFMDFFGFGVGLGGHEQSYPIQLNGKEYLYGYGINSKSGHSLLIRLFSEIPWLLFLLLHFTFSKKNKFRNRSFEIIFLACISHFIVKSIKLGGYFDYGSIFFFVLIIYCIRLDNFNKNIRSQ